MIAHVALLRRMPRRMDYLDYSVPENLVVNRGDLVLVPFRAASFRGVVLSLSATDSPPSQGGVGGGSNRLRPITSLIEKNVISESELATFETIASDLIQSTSTMLHDVFAPARSSRRSGTDTGSSTIQRTEVPHIQAAIEMIKANDTIFVEAIDLVQANAIVEAIKKTIPGPHRVFVPHHHDADLISGSLTRIGALALGQKLAIDIVLRSGVPEHASYDRNPRYDAREIVWQLHRADGRKVVFIDVCPRVLDLVRFENRLTIPIDLVPPATVINLTDQKKVGFSSLLTEPLLDAISEALQSKKNVLLSYNRKGVSTALICRDCAYVPRCMTCGGVPTVYEETLACHHCGSSAPIMLTCPKCQGTNLKARGVGNQQIEKKLRELFPDVEVVRIEKDGDKLVAGSHPMILLATSYYINAILDPFHPPAFGLVADLMADLGLSDPSYSASEQTLHRLLELSGIAFRARAPFIVQTWDAALTKKMLLNHSAFLEEERSLREQAHFPPYGMIYRLSTRGEATIAETKQTLSSALAGLRMREHEERKKPILEIYAHIGQSGNLHSALKELKDDVIIEVNPE